MTTLEVTGPGLVALREALYLTGSMSVTPPLSALPPGTIARLIRETAGLSRELVASTLRVSVSSLLRFEDSKVRTSTTLALSDAYRRLLAACLVAIKRYDHHAYKAIQDQWAAASADWPTRYDEEKDNNR